MMQMENLGISGQILLGTGKFGGIVEESASFRLIDCYRDLGGRIIDTGHCYGMFPPNRGRQPLAERTIGKYLKGHGIGNLLICTKGGYPDLDTRRTRLNEEDLTSDLEKSLKELGLECVDIYYLHRDDEKIPVSEIMPILDGFVRQGKVRALGASNWSPERVRQANEFACENGCAAFEYVQNLRNLGQYVFCPMNDSTMRISQERDVEAFRQMQNLQFVAYSAQAYGFFSKAMPGDEVGVRRLLREKYPFFDAEKMLERLQRVWRLADQYKQKPSAIVLSFLLSDVDAPAVVIGCTSEAQLTETMLGAGLRISQKEIAYLRADFSSNRNEA